MEEIAQSYGESKAKSKKKPPSVEANIKPVVDNLSAFFGSKIQFKRKPNGTGQIVVNFKSDDDFNRILDLIDDKKA